MWREDRSASFKVLLVGLNGMVFLIHPFAGVVGWLLFCFLLTFTPRAASNSGAALLDCRRGTYRHVPDDRRLRLHHVAP